MGIEKELTLASLFVEPYPRSGRSDHMKNIDKLHVVRDDFSWLDGSEGIITVPEEFRDSAVLHIPLCPGTDASSSQTGFICSKEASGLIIQR